jgi:hypothetical protein
MGWRFQKRITILPGVRLNLSRRGVSTSLGPRGADVNMRLGRKPTVNLGIPGSGLSTRFSLTGSSDEPQTTPAMSERLPAPNPLRRFVRLFLISFVVLLLLIGYLTSR